MHYFIGVHRVQIIESDKKSSVFCHIHNRYLKKLHNQTFSNLAYFAKTKGWFWWQRHLHDLIVMFLLTINKIELDIILIDRLYPLGN